MNQSEVIGWESGSILFRQSQSAAIQNQGNREITCEAQLKTSLEF